jgi:hypothetical protein
MRLQWCKLCGVPAGSRGEAGGRPLDRGWVLRAIDVLVVSGGLVCFFWSPVVRHAVIQSCNHSSFQRLLAGSVFQSMHLALGPCFVFVISELLLNEIHVKSCSRKKA